MTKKPKFAKCFAPTKLRAGKKPKRVIGPPRMPIHPEAFESCQKRRHQHCPFQVFVQSDPEVMQGLVTGQEAHKRCKRQTCQCACHMTHPGTDTEKAYRVESLFWVAEAKKAGKRYQREDH